MGHKANKYKATRAIHLYWAKDMTQQEIADQINVSVKTVNKYIHDSPQSAEVKEQLLNLESQVRHLAVAELRQQFLEVSKRKRTAEKPVEVWQDDDGNLQIRDVQNEYGEVVDRKPIPVDFKLAPDEKARYVARDELRDILQMLVDITGAAEPDAVEVMGEGGGALNVRVERGKVDDE